MKNLIFVDLDETLIHTFMTTWGETPTESAKTIYLNADGSTDVYHTELREGAVYFLSILRNLGEVYMLTAATKDYALAMNEEFGLGFGEKRIYSREDIQFGELTPSHFDKGTVYLFDNLPRHENHSKIRFLRPLGEINYVVVPEFTNNKVSSHFTHSMIASLLGNIKS